MYVCVCVKCSVRVRACARVCVGGGGVRACLGFPACVCTRVCTEN